MTRRESREQAFALIFEKGFREELSVAQIAESATEARDVTVSDFAMALAKGTEAHWQEVDGKIDSFSLNWKKERISRVALAILRMAIFEMIFVEDIPHSITINEAVELTKKYGGEDDSSFVNGILGSISRDPETAEKS